MKLGRIWCSLALPVALAMAMPASAGPFFFSTGDPDGMMATASRPASAGKIETESADDFVLSQTTSISNATFTGLIPAGAGVSKVVLEIYRVFPKDSTVPPSGNVPTRNNSPSDVAFTTRDSSAGELSFMTSLINPNFTAANSVLNGINKVPNQQTRGEGPVSGNEVLFSVSLNKKLDLPADHYFFVPQVQLDNGDFFWLSAPKPIVPPGTPFPPGTTDLRNGSVTRTSHRTGCVSALTSWACR